MVTVSIVIITKNEADVIAACIKEAAQITDDIIIVDSGSTDGTPDIAQQYGCRVFKTTWDGYGANKNKGIAKAKYNWILSIDADEIPDNQLIAALHQADLSIPSTVYDIKFQSYLGQKPIRFGSWGRDHHIRLFNRTAVKWSETMVHETLVLPDNVVVKKIAGRIHHYSVKNAEEYADKSFFYAKLSAKKYFKTGKRANAVKLYCSPLFGFLKNYLFNLGFLDGAEGWQIAAITLKNTIRKYHFLSQMETRPPVKKDTVRENLAVEY